MLIFEVACWALDRALAIPIEHNKALLQHRFRAIVREHILDARTKLDAVTVSSEKTLRQISSAGELLAYNWRDSFMLEVTSDSFKF